MLTHDALQTALEESTAKERFNMHDLSLVALSMLKDSSTSRQYPNIVIYLGERTGNYILESLLRVAFLIEAVKTPKIETTKMEVRWTDRLSPNDPRYATYEDCLQIFEEGIASVENVLGDGKKCEILQILATKHHLPYELPLDYKHREMKGQIHHPSNMLWLWDDEGVRRAIKLRAYLTNKTNNPAYSSVFAKVYLDKIKVKTYLTDRVLTGEYKTNREKRWEVHPASVHFAFRRTCMDIEHRLVTQLCSFEGFPLELRQRLDYAKLLGPCATPYRCPITLDPLHFEQFVTEILQPIHGKSDFQVGHLNLLKAVNDDLQSGHTALNIGWISSNGNRIQGSLTLDQTRKLLGRIVKNYDLLELPLKVGTEEETKGAEEIFADE